MAEGIKGDNSRITRTIPIVSVKELKEGFLFGVKLSDDNGEQLKDEVIQQFINNAVAFLETELDICIAERMFAGPSFSQEGDKLNGNCEEKDYKRTAYQNWGFTQLNNFPCGKSFGIESGISGKSRRCDIPTQLVQNTEGNRPFKSNACHWNAKSNGSSARKYVSHPFSI